MRHLWAVATPLAALVLALPSCNPGPPEQVLDPDIVGEIIAVDGGEEVHWVIELASGEKAEVELTGTNVLFGVGPHVGELYLAGGTDEARWHAFLALEGDCWIAGSYAHRDGQRLTFQNGIRLPLSTDMDFGWPGDDVEVYGDPRTRFCVNAEGVVTSYRGPG